MGYQERVGVEVDEGQQHAATLNLSCPSAHPHSNHARHTATQGDLRQTQWRQVDRHNGDNA
eukprot:3080452-Rhodomonas_salina.1